MSGPRVIELAVRGVLGLARDAQGNVVGHHCHLRLSDGNRIGVTSDTWPDGYWPPEPGDVIRIGPPEIVGLERPRGSE